MSAGQLLATDLDRTLLPNGVQEESPGVRALLADFALERGLRLAYVSGRRLELVEAAIAEYSLPAPEFVVADVGSSLFAARASGWELDEAWARLLAEDWGGRTSTDLAGLLADVPHLQLQEPEAQARFKLSYFAPLDAEPETLLRPARAILGSADLCASVVYSIDEAAGRGLVDVLPARGTKLGALEFLMAEHGLAPEDVVFAGDSGNDLEVLVSELPAVLVANAAEALRERASAEAASNGRTARLYAAHGILGLNGNYAAGILEGWTHYHPEDLERLTALHAARSGDPQ